jgi:hypothetical protein
MRHSGHRSCPLYGQVLTSSGADCSNSSLVCGAIATQTSEPRRNGPIPPAPKGERPYFPLTFLAPSSSATGGEYSDSTLAGVSLPFLRALAIASSREFSVL